jgi:hypothetical protein
VYYISWTNKVGHSRKQVHTPPSRSTRGGDDAFDVQSRFSVCFWIKTSHAWMIRVQIDCGGCNAHVDHHKHSNR